MPLVEQRVPLQFRDLNTKPDSRYLLVGDLTVLRNVVFDEWPRLKKRPGSGLLATASAGGQLAAYKSQLLVGTGAEAYGLVGASLVDKGVLEAMTLTVGPAARDIYPKQTVDAAVHPAGITVHTFESVESGSTIARYTVVDTATGQPIVSNVSLGATATRPKPLTLGNYVVIVYFDTSTNRLRFMAIPVLAPTSPIAAADVATDSASSAIFDATVIGGLQGQAFVAYLTSGGKLAVTFITSSLIAGAELQAVTAALTGVAVFGDAAGNVWLAYATASSVAIVAYDYSLTTQQFAPVTVDASPGTVRNITGIAPASTATLFYEAGVGNGAAGSLNNLIRTATVAFGGTPPTLKTATPSTTGGTLAAGTYFYRVTALGSTGETLGSNELSATTTGTTSSVALSWAAVTGATGYRVYRGTAAGGESVFYAPGNVTSYTDTNASSTAGTVPTASSFAAVSGVGVYIRSLGLASKPFYYLGRMHVLAAYDSVPSSGVALQRTYFLLSGPSATVVGKLAPGVGGGVTVRSLLPEVANPSSGVYQTSYLQTDEIGAQAGIIVSQAGAMLATFDFTQPQSSVELSDDLHLSGGVLSMFDGAQVCEHGFHLYPEGLQVTAGGSGSISGTYQVVAVYEWMDAQGLIHQSSPSPAVSVTASSAAYFNYTVASLRVTSKATRVAVVFYRTIANQSVFYRVTSIAAPVLNDPTVDTVSAPSNADTTADTALQGNAQLIFNPLNPAAELPPLAAPAPRYVWRYRNRVAMIPAENPYQWLYSKAFVPGVPIEFNGQQLYQPVSQDGGPLTCGIEMDGFNVLFTATRVYQVAGDGPAPNGSSSDYGSAPQNVPSDVGCSNPRSLVLTPAGVMFQASGGKGIYLLDRGMNVRYIGDKVEAWNGLTITAARLAPNSRRVVFFTNGGVALAYDYFIGKWSVWDNVNAVDATVFGGLITHLRPDGGVRQETPGQFTDAGSPILIGLTTSKIAFAGIGGFQRVYRFSVIGDYRSAHKLQVSVAFDDAPAPTQFSTVDAGTLLGQPVADSDLAGVDSPGGGAFGPYEFVVKLAQQKCRSVQITIQEAQAGPTYGEGFALSALMFRVGVKAGLHPVPASRAI